MAGLGSGVDSLRPFMDGDPIFDRISRGPRSARTPAFVTAREITPKSFGLLVRAVDKGVDRLATHRPQTAFVSRFQPTRDLLGRPSFRKTIANESPQFLIFFDYGFTPPAQLIGSGGVKRRITPAREAVAPQFPRHGGFRSLKRPGDLADRAAGRPHDRDLVSFLVQQM